MCKAFFQLFILGALLLFTLPAMAADFQIGKVQYSGTGWGNDTAQFSITNLSLDYKWVMAKADISFGGPGPSPFRTFHRPFFLEPSGSSRQNIAFQIPGNYGKCIIKLSLYDVIDTLDELYESQIFFANVDTVTYAVPAAVKTVIGAPLNVPVFVDKSELFDNQFNRMLVYLLNQGKSAAEIAQLTSADTVFVNRTINLLLQRNFIRSEGGKIKAGFAVIDPATLDRLKPVIEKTIDDLSARLTAVSPAYDSLIASLIKENKLTSDSNNIMDGGSILHHKYLTILALFLWDRMGCSFVNDGTKFNIFDLSDPCDADMGKFMSLVAGDNTFIGKTFYYAFSDNEGFRFYCGDSDPTVECTALSRPMTALRTYYQWQFGAESLPIFYNYNAEKAEPVLSMLEQKTAPSVLKLKNELVKIFAGEKINELPGARYWCWSLVVSSVMDNLQKTKILTKEVTGIYLLNRVTD